MPINKEKSRRVQVTLSIEEYERLRREVKDERKSGRKMTASKYVAEILRNNWQLEDMFGVN